MWCIKKMKYQKQVFLLNFLMHYKLWLLWFWCIHITFSIPYKFITGNKRLKEKMICGVFRWQWNIKIKIFLLHFFNALSIQKQVVQNINYYSYDFDVYNVLHVTFSIPCYDIPEIIKKSVLRWLFSSVMIAFINLCSKFK